MVDIAEKLKNRLLEQPVFSQIRSFLFLHDRTVAF